jgi:hypothetical protein
MNVIRHRNDDGIRTILIRRPDGTVRVRQSCPLARINMILTGAAASACWHMAESAARYEEVRSK